MFKIVYFLNCSWIDFNSCDSREIAVPYEIPFEGTKIFVNAQIIDGEVANIVVKQTTASDGEIIVDYGDLLTANVGLYENDELVSTFQLQSDTSLDYQYF